METQRIFITGATRGIGFAMATALLNAGHIVGVNFRSSEQIATEMRTRYSDHCFPFRFDVSDHAAASEGIESFAAAAGGMDCLINNAGILTPGLHVRSTIKSISDQIAVNLMGALYCTKFALPYLMRSKSGLVINIGSVASSRPTAGQAAYSASKGGLEAFTKAVAVEYASKNLRSICINPGPVDTDLLQPTLLAGKDQILSRIPCGRLCATQEVAQLIMYILSPAGAFINGSTVTLDGGYSQT